MDAITLLKQDHRTVEGLFKRFEKAGDRAYKEKRAIVDRIIEELSIHAVVEEQVFYPVARATVPATEDVALESLEEHHIVKWVLSELDGMDPEHERFDAKVTILIENVRHHVKEEEQDFFPKVRDELGRRGLADLGEAMADAKKLAPTHPHPLAPDVPPANVVAGATASMVDRVGDLVGSLRGRRSASGGHKSANKVRSSAADAADAVIESVREAKRATKSARKSAEKSAKKSAPKSTRKATTAASRARATTTSGARKAVRRSRPSATRSR
jgi:hemerythrin superfamily protein